MKTQCDKLLNIKVVVFMDTVVHCCVVDCAFGGIATFWNPRLIKGMVI